MVMENMTPLVEELYPPPEPEVAFRRLCRLPYCIFLDSSLKDPRLGRFSFLAADPFDVIRVSPEYGDGLVELTRRMDSMRAASIPDLPPFQGGAAGLISYDMCRSLEYLPPPSIDEFHLPVLVCGIYDVVLAFDHQTNRAWVISHGFPEMQRERRERRAAERLRKISSQLAVDLPVDIPIHQTSRQQALPVARLAAQFSVGRSATLTSNLRAEQYLKMVERAIEYICAGDVFQVNLSQRLLHPSTDDSVSLYLRLRHRNPAPFSGYFDARDFQIASASPERFLQLRDDLVEARPIKGTRPRTISPEADLYAGEDLENSEKDLAENVMIVDLLRNDLSRVCRPDTVSVAQLCELETYQFVQHLVSAVTGKLSDGHTAVDLIRAAFPGGSITGAPKVRAMEIIAELEPTARGPYCGSLGYLGFDGSLDLNILIRTMTASRGWWQFPVGGGITAQSVPQREYEETWHKAEGMIRALH